MRPSAILKRSAGLTPVMAPQSPSTQFDGEPLSVTVVREIAADDGIEPTELSPPLFQCIDPAALDALFESTATGGPRTGRVTFRYDGKRVTVDSDGAVTIESESPPNRTPSR